MNMPNVAVEIRWSDEEEQQRAHAAIQDLDGKVTRELDGLIEAEVPGETLDVLKERQLCFSFPHKMQQSEGKLAASEIEEDPFPQRVKLAKLSEQTKDAIRQFALKSLNVGLKKTNAFFMRLEPRKKRRPEMDGLRRELQVLTGAATGEPPAEDEEKLSEDAYLVRLKGPSEAAWRKELEAIAPLGDHRPPHTFRMLLTPEHLAAVEALPYVQAVKRYGLFDTLTPAMVQMLDKVHAEKGAEVGQFELTVHMPAAVASVVERLSKTSGVKVLDQGRTSVRFQVAVNSPVLAALAQLPVIRTLSPFAPPQLFLDQARPLVGVDTVSPPTPQAPHGPWDGSGEKVAVFDSGVDPNHPDIAPALASPPASYKTGVAIDANGHGTHVAGIIAGRGIASDGLIRGVAPGASIASFGMVDPQGALLIPIDLGEMLKLAVEAKAKIINLSWGKRLHFDYDVYGESIDRFVRKNPEVLVVVAAGNEGVAAKEQGPRLGFHMPQTIGMPAAAKNVVTVGACCNRRNGYQATWGQLKGSEFPDPPAGNEPVVSAVAFPAAISSRGPTGFDAVKPDILAPGTMVLSARANGAEAAFVPFNPPAPLGAAPYGYLNGTSMAAPIVAGAAALLRQFLRVKRATAKPSAALLKALLILSARRLVGANANSVLRDNAPVMVGFPDFDQGFGLLDLRNLLPHAEAPGDRKLAFHDVANTDDQALEARVPAGSHTRSFRTYKLEVPADSATPLGIALVWTDHPGRGVQNLLSLALKLPNGTSLAGNHDRKMFLDDFAVAMGALPFDKKNTAQLVTIPNPAKATYRITVRAEATTAPPQGYALAACGPLKDETLKPLF